MPMAKPLLEYYLSLPAQDNLESPVFPGAFSITHNRDALDHYQISFIPFL